MKKKITKKDILLNIFRNRFYLVIFGFGLSMLLFIPIVVSTAIIPAFKNLLMNNIVNQSKQVASHLSNSIEYRNNDIDEIDRLVNQELQEFNIDKIHYFDKKGIIIYSTLRNSIGTINTHPYFHNIVAQGELYYKLDHKGGKTAEGESVITDLIEIYIPIMKNGKFDGAFELYYNITEEEKRFSVLSNNVTLVNVLISLILGVIMFIMLYNASKNNLNKEKLLRYNFKIQENLKDKTLELLATNGSLSNSVLQLAKIQKELLSSQKIANNARKNAEEANREKSMFLANISHELKTPLNGISGLVYLSKLKIKDEEVLKNLSNIQDYAETLLRMISDLLDSSKMDAKKITIENSVFNLKEMLESIKQLYSIECDEKKIDFVLNYDKAIPNQIISDPVRIHQVITNLLNNAVKFTQKGAVRLSVNIKAIDEKQVKIEFKVKDDGIGIKEEELKNIFKPFYQTEESLSYFAGGSGLGLNICQKIVEQVDGIIWADSIINEGSTFFVLIEFDIANNNEEILKGVTLKDENFVCDNSSKRVLVVDDNKINRDVLDGILKSIGITCDMAINGFEALEMVKQNHYEIVLTDIKMPIMDGCELSKKIREIYPMEELPIITISANTRDHGNQCLQSCGVNEYIQKPINPESFLKVLAKYIGCKLNATIESSNNTIFSNGILDKNSALIRFVNNETLYKRTLKTFIRDYENSFDKINELLEQQKTKELIDYLHTIKGISANLSAIKFSEITTQLHDTIIYGKKYDRLLEDYKTEFYNLKSEIEKYLNNNDADNSETISRKSLDYFDTDQKDEILATLLKYCKEHNTKATSYFNELPVNINQDDFLNELEKDIFNYDFKSAQQKIETYFSKNK